MKKHKYLMLLMQQPIEWVKASANEPNEKMTKIHVILHKIAIRRLKRTV